MKKTTTQDDQIQAELLTILQACKLTGLGISSLRNRAKECGAELKIGKCVRIDKEKLMAYLRTFEA